MNLKIENTSTINVKKLRISDKRSIRYKTFDVFYTNINELITECHNLCNSVPFIKVYLNLTDNEGLSINDIKLLETNDIYIL